MFLSLMQEADVKKHSRFTMVELLTVVAIIGLLVGTIFAVSKIMREKARITGTKSDLSNLKTAVFRYTSDFGFAPPDGLAPKGEEGAYPDRAFNYKGSVGEKFEDWENDERVFRSTCGLVFWLDYFKVVNRDLNFNNTIEPDQGEVQKVRKFYNNLDSNYFDFDPGRLKGAYRIYNDVYAEYFDGSGNYEDSLRKVGVYLDWFGQPYIYRRNNKNEFIIYSFGPDKNDNSTPASSMTYTPPAAVGMLATHSQGTYEVTGSNIDVDLSEQTAAKNSDDIHVSQKPLFP